VGASCPHVYKENSMSRQFARILHSVIDNESLSCQARFVYVTLFRYVDNSNYSEPVKISTLKLSEKCQISQSAVKRALKELIDAEYIRRETRYKKSALTYILKY
jgi:DNA-binding MarR family transcriptional regulator